MNARPKLTAALLSAGLMAAAAPGFAAEVVEIVSPATTYYYVPAPSDTRTYYYVTEGPTYSYRAPTVTYSAPTVTEVIYESSPIIVEAPRTEDQRITNDVVNTLANDPYLSGRIAVQTYERDVNLSGSVTTPGQVRRAVRNAKSVWGVENVTNELRPRVGANTSY
jgi:hypothetical protein